MNTKLKSMKIIDKNKLASEKTLDAINQFPSVIEKTINNYKEFPSINNIEFIFSNTLLSKIKDALHYTIEVDTFIIINNKKVAVDGKVTIDNTNKLLYFRFDSGNIYKTVESLKGEAFTLNYKYHKNLFSEKEIKMCEINLQRREKRNYSDNYEERKSFLENYNSRYKKEFLKIEFKQKYDCRHEVCARIHYQQREVDVYFHYEGGFTISSKIKKKYDDVPVTSCILLKEWEQEGYSHGGNWETKQHYSRKTIYSHKEWEVSYNNIKQIITTIKEKLS